MGSFPLFLAKTESALFAKDIVGAHGLNLETKGSSDAIFSLLQKETRALEWLLYDFPRTLGNAPSKIDRCGLGSQRS
jgi:hypothetical protein